MAELSQWLEITATAVLLLSTVVLLSITPKYVRISEKFIAYHVVLLYSSVLKVIKLIHLVCTMLALYL